MISLAAALAVAPAPGQQAITGLSAVDLFNAADQARKAGRDPDALALYEALARDPDAEVRAEARFRAGMLLADLKRYTEAAVMFRALLDEKPQAARVRLELARILTAMGDEGAARRSLRQAQASGLPPDVAVVVDQFANVLRSRKRLGGSIEVAVAPDSNVNRATAARTLDTVIAPLTLSDDARARSGIGASLAGQAYARVPLSAHLSLVPRISGSGSFYKEAAFNDSSGSALTGLEWATAHNRISPSLGLTWRWYGNNLYARTQTANIDWIHAIGRTTQLTVNASASRARYVVNALQDGGIFDVRVGLEHAFSARSGVGGTLSTTRQTAKDPGYATVSGGLSVSAWREAGKATLFGSATARRTLGDERLFLFADRRREWFYQLSAGVTMRQITVHGFAPVIRMTWERNRSTVGLYDYRRLVSSFGVTRAF